MQNLKAYIATIEFDCRRNRYDAAQVDEFIANVLDRLKTIEAKMEALQAENARHESQSASMVAALITAQKNSSAMLEKAKTEADLILAAAKREGDDFVKAMYDRQAEMENEYMEEKRQIVKEIADLKRFQEKYRRAVEREIVEVLGKISGVNSKRIWNQMPEELRKEYGMDDTYEGLDLNEIIKDLPETDSELKAMIEGLL